MFGCVTSVSSAPRLSADWAPSPPCRTVVFIGSAADGWTGRQLGPPQPCPSSSVVTAAAGCSENGAAAAKTAGQLPSEPVPGADV